MPRNNERLFVDLIFRASNKYASWDPEVSIEAGDYGRITLGKRNGMKFWKRGRGTFLKEGNIYKEHIAEKFDIPLPEEHGAESTDGITWITSRNAREVDLTADIGAQTPAFAECSVKAAFTFTSGSGAVLAMTNDTITTISPAGKLRRLLDDDHMRGLVLVSEVHRCASYARYLSTDGAAKVAVGLSAEPAVANIGSVNFDAKWVHKATSGNFKARVNKMGKREFFPLFRLVALVDKDVANGLRGGLDDDLPLPDAEPPWAPMEDETSKEVPQGRREKKFLGVPFRIAHAPAKTRV